MTRIQSVGLNGNGYLTKEKYLHPKNISAIPSNARKRMAGEICFAGIYTTKGVLNLRWINPHPKKGTSLFFFALFFILWPCIKDSAFRQ